MKCEDVFKETYNREPLQAFCPYRVCPLGAHIDHQDGMIHGMALDYGVHIAYGIKQNGIVELQSLNFPKRVQFHVNDVPESKCNDWGDYLRGVTIELGKKYKLKKGICGVIKGALPSGGISSSAALTICYLKALCAANDIQLDDSDYVFMSKRAENLYVGVSTGILDQSCETLCKEDSLLALDCSNNNYSNNKAPENMPPFKIGIFFSGLQRNLSQSSAYNNRVDECKAAAFALYSFACSDPDYNDIFEPGLKFSDMKLRMIPESLFDKYKDNLPPNWKKRATHYFSEINRVKDGIALWNKGDLVSYGKLINESGLSSIHNYECGSPELIKLYEILSKLDGVYGTRFSGAGFRGCCMALIDPEHEEEISEIVEREYLKAFPEFEGKYKAYFCLTANGVGRKEGGSF